MTRIPPRGRLAVTVVVALYGFWLLRGVGDHFSLLDNIDLAIHETGHIVFGPFGEFIGFLGGTLFQLIVPAVFLGHFLYRRDSHAASVMMFWVAQNFWNISVYVKDARSMELPLVGGEHDWSYLLYEMDLMEQDQVIGGWVFAIGVVLFFVSIGWGVVTWNREEVKSEE